MSKPPIMVIPNGISVIASGISVIASGISVIASEAKQSHQSVVMFKEIASSLCSSQ